MLRDRGGSVADVDRINDMLEAARAAQRNAHAPYSNYKVGAAMLTAAGNVYAGCNVENAAYPQGACAEAGAIAAMVAAGEREIVAVLTVADGDELGTCCGGGRPRHSGVAPARPPLLPPAPSP